MNERVLFYKKSVNGISCKGFYIKKDREQKIGEIMAKVYETSMRIKKRHIDEEKIMI